MTINELADELNHGNEIQIVALVVDETEVKVVFTNGSPALTSEERSRTFVDQFLEPGLPTDRLSPVPVQIEVRSLPLPEQFLQPPILGVLFAGLLMGAGAVLVVVRIRKASL